MANLMEISVKPIGLDRLAAAFEIKAYNKMISGALRYMSRGVKTEAGKAISSRYNITSRAVKEGVGAGRVNLGGLSLLLPLSDQPRSARTYGAKQIGDEPGVAVKWFRSGGKAYYPNAWWMSVRGGDRLPFIRPHASGRPYGVLYGPSIAGILLSDESRFGRDVRADLYAKAERQFSTGLDRELSRRSRGY